MIDKKRWVIADIHGCYKTLLQLIEHKIQPNKQDIIYFLGDYIDRGEKSKQVIDYIIDLKDNGYTIEAIKGNHEDVFIQCYHAKKKDRMDIALQELYAGWLKYGGKNTLDSFYKRKIEKIPERYIHFLEGLPYHIELDDYILVHAGLNFFKDNPFDDTESMLWTKNFFYVPEKVEFKKVLHGHVPKSLNQIKQAIESNANVIPLDNGCVYHDRYGMGNLVAFELNTNKLVVQKNIETKLKFSYSQIINKFSF